MDQYRYSMFIALKKFNIEPSKFKLLTNAEWSFINSFDVSITTKAKADQEQKLLIAKMQAEMNKRFKR